VIDAFLFGLFTAGIIGVFGWFVLHHADTTTELRRVKARMEWAENMAGTAQRLESTLRDENKRLRAALVIAAGVSAADREEA
jgi:hypothetical protein